MDSSSNGDQNGSSQPAMDIDVHMPFLRAMSYLLLGLSCMQSHYYPQQLPDKLQVFANQFGRNSLASAPVGCFVPTSKAADRLMETQCLKLDLEMRAIFGISQSKPESLIRRFKRKRLRKVPRETVLSKLDELDRDLDDDEFDSLVDDLVELPYRIEEYEEILEVEEKIQHRIMPLAFLSLSRLLRWKTPLFQICLPRYDDEPLTDLEEQLLLQSTDEWLELEDDDSEDDLTEMDIWILHNATFEADAGESFHAFDRSDQQPTVTPCERKARDHHGKSDRQSHPKPFGVTKNVDESEASKFILDNTTNNSNTPPHRSDAPIGRQPKQEVFTSGTGKQFGFGWHSWPCSSMWPAG